MRGLGLIDVTASASYTLANSSPRLYAISVSAAAATSLTRTSDKMLKELVFLKCNDDV